MQSQSEAEAPGSMFIMGEYAVLEGSKAVLMTLRHRLKVTLTPADSLEIQSDRFGKYKDGDERKPQHVVLCENVLEQFRKARPDKGRKGLRIEIKSDIPADCGFASSAALVAALVKALHILFDEDASFEDLFRMGHGAIVDTFGAGSGADLAAAISDLPFLVFDPGQCTVVPFSLPFAVQAIYTGYKTPTPEVLRQVEAEVPPARWKKITRRMKNCVEGFIADPGVGLIGEYQKYMDALGVTCDPCRKALDIFEARGIAAKISGSGRGDCVIGLSQKPADSIRINPPFVFFSYKDLCAPLQKPASSGPRLAGKVRALEDQYAARILGSAHRQEAVRDSAEAFMPSNIALIKYWGKRQEELNLPLVSSLSYTLGKYGTTTSITLSDADSVTMNGESLDPADKAFVRIMHFLDLFRARGEHYKVVTANNIPTASGVASSASGFAALLECLSILKGWEVSAKEKSMLARLGSGSAARSFWPGLVLWHKGDKPDGMDCYAEPAPFPQDGDDGEISTSGICMTVMLLDRRAKIWPSGAAMKVSMSSSPLAARWPDEQQGHLDEALDALERDDFPRLGIAVERNAILLHNMLSRSTPAIHYARPETITMKKQVREWRAEGLSVYFTQDAGANLKVIYPRRLQPDIEGRLKALGVDYFTV